MLTLDRPGPNDCTPSVVIATLPTETAARALADTLPSAVAFTARRNRDDTYVTINGHAVRLRRDAHRHMERP